MSKIIITAAITGAVHIPTMTDYLPLTPEQIIEDAVKSYEAGAAIAHIHVREPKDGRPSANADLFEQVLSGVKKRCNIILLPTTGGGIDQTLEEKLVPVKNLRPEMCSFDPAPFNLGIFQIADRYKKFKHEWEPEYMNFWKTITFAPTFESDIEYAKTFLETDTKPEFEIYEIGHIGYVKWLMDEKLVKLPPHLQFVMGGMVGWMTPSVKHLVDLYDEAVDVIGKGQFTWSVAGGGRWQIRLAAAAMAMDAPNVRVGLEDSIYARKGDLATSSADQVKMVIRVAKEFGIEPATPDEARETFNLKGIDKVNF